MNYTPLDPVRIIGYDPQRIKGAGANIKDLRTFPTRTGTFHERRPT
jgi:hypothetical protein